MAYRIGPDASLLRQPLPNGLCGGLMGLMDQDAPPLSHPGTLANAILRECGRQRYIGVVLDFQEPVREDLRQLARCLGDCFSKSRLLLCGPASLNEVPGLLPLVCSSISGGNLRAYLQEVSTRTRGRFALDLQRLRMDFSLPAREGTGRPLTAQQFQTLWDRHQPTSFFSSDLGARYFSYQEGRTAHLVLYDDEDTLRRKLRMAAALNCPLALLMWPEVRDLMEKKETV